MAAGGMGQNDVRVRFTGDASALEQTIQGLMQQIEQLRQQAGSINIGGAGGRGGGGGGAGAMGGVSSGTGIAQRSVMPSPTPIGTPGRGTSSTTRAVAAVPSGATLNLTASVSPTIPMPTQILAQAGGVPSVPLQPTVMMPAANLPGQPQGGMLSRFQNRFSNLGWEQMASFGFAGQTAADVYSQYQQSAIQRVMTNRPDIMSEAAMQGSLVGGALGFGAGMLTGQPMLAAFGAGIGSTFGASTFSRWAAGEERAAKTSAMLLGAGGLRSSLGGAFMDTQAVGESSVFDPAGGGRVGRVPTAIGSAKHLQAWVKGLAGRAQFSDTSFNPSEDDIAQSYGSIQESLITGGVDPNRAVGLTSLSSKQTYVDPRYMERSDYWHKSAMEHYAEANRVRGGADIGDKARRLGYDARSWEYQLRTLADRESSISAMNLRRGTRTRSVSSMTQEELAMHITENLTQRYGRATPEIAGQVAPILGSLPETGSNIVDILRKFGAGATSRFVEGLTEVGQAPSINVRSLMETDTRFRGLERERAFIDLRHRDQGYQKESLFGDQMGVLSTLPGGKDSLAYREVEAKKRLAMFQRFEEQDAVEFSIPHARLQGERDRSRILPFSASNSYANELRNIGLVSGHLTTLEKRFSTLKEAGALSEQQELAMVQQMEGARTQVAASVATLSEGMEQYLSPLMAGRTAWSGRFNTANLAALRLGRIGSLSREFGAMGGGQLRGQDALFASFGVSSNYGGSGAPHSSGEVLALLRRIAQALEGSNGGSGARPAEARGTANAAQRRSGVDSNALYNHAN